MAAPLELAKIYGDKPVPEDELKKFNAFSKDKKKQEGFIDYLRQEHEKNKKKEAKKSRKNGNKKETPIAENTSATQSQEEVPAFDPENPLDFKLSLDDDMELLVEKKKRFHVGNDDLDVRELPDFDLGEFKIGEQESVTPAESRDALREAVRKLEEIEIPAKAFEVREGYVRQRSAELDAKAEKLGIVERGFRKIGERYNKLGWKSKLAVGLGLGIGAGIGSAVSMPLALACMSGVFAQRVAGMASMFLKYEQGFQDGKRKKERAMGAAIAYTAGMTGLMFALSEGVKEGVQYAQQHGWTESVQSWLAHHWPGHHEPAIDPNNPPLPPAAHPEAAPAAPAAEMQQPAAAAAAGNAPETAAPAAHSAVPEAPAPAHLEMQDIAAVHGRGYEQMLYKMGQALHDKYPNGLPSGVAANSDAAKLWEAVQEDGAGHLHKHLQGAVHRIATEHGFFRVDGTSVRIDPSAHMTIGADGQIHLADATHPDMIEAAPGMHTTPAYSAEAAESSVAPQASLEVHETLPPPNVPPPPAPNPPPLESHTAPAVGAPVAEAAATHMPTKLEPPMDGDWGHWGTPSHYSAMPPEPVAYAEAPVAHAAEVPMPGAPAPEALSHVESPVVADVVEQAHSFVNNFDIEVSETEPRLYADKAGRVFAYGGSDESRFKLVQEYLAQSKGKDVVVRWAHTIKSLLGSQVRVEDLRPAPAGSTSAFVMESHFFQPKAPNPNDFAKVINTDGLKK